MRTNFFRSLSLGGLLLSLWACSDTSTTATSSPQSNLQIEIRFPKERSEVPLDGRLLLFLADNDEVEPRYQSNTGAQAQLLFGMDVEDMKPGEAVVFKEAEAYGYPIKKLSEIPPGVYYAQALLHRYETFTRADGHTVKLPMDRGEGQQWQTAPGNLFSDMVRVEVKANGTSSLSLALSKENPALAPPIESDYIKYVKIKSELLSKFWGRDMYLGAFVLLPEGFEEHPEAKYPLCVFHGHFPSQFGGFRETPPDADLEPDYSERFQVAGYNKVVQEESYNFYKWWTGPEAPRMLVIKIQHANPYYDDSYAVNSANLGPYGDAITYELIPYLEEKYRGIGEGWSRFLYGGSTGGWEALAAQVFYPEEYNACFAACPDPIDFRAYTVVNLYEDKNAYYEEGSFQKILRPGRRDYLGHIGATLEGMNHRELALGSHSRSGDQWDIWEAVYSPVGPDGYPKRIWDKRTGVIDTTVAAYWRENYDLSYILRRDWPELGPKLKGKLHIYCGDMDNYYLNNAVYLVQDYLESTEAPYYEGEITYGDRAEHCWNGDPNEPNHISRLRYNSMYMDKIMLRIRESAPAGADTSSWRY